MPSAAAQAATIVVNTVADNTNVGDGNCRLREAIKNANTNSDSTNGDCVGGSALPIIDAIAFKIQSNQPSRTLITVPSTVFTIEFFANTSEDSSIYGAGEIPLGSITVTTSDTGEAAFTAILPSTHPRQWVTATATDSKGNISEFSRAIQVQPKP